MDPILRALLDRLTNEDLAASQPLTDEELTTARTSIVEILASIDRTRPTDEDLSVIEEGVGVLAVIDAQIAERSDAAAERASRADALLDGLELPVAQDEEPEPEPEVPADPAPAEGEPAPAEPVAEGGEQLPVPEPVAADARPVLQRPSISRLASRTPRRARPVPTATTAPARRTIMASGDMPEITAGSMVDLEQWGRGVAMKWHAMEQGAPGDGVQMIHLGKVRNQYPDEWMMTNDPLSNDRKLAEITAQRAPGATLLASGGICGPVAADYSITTIAVADRPARDGMVQTGAARGGVRFILPHTLASVHADAPASLWTQGTDAAPGNTTKGRATYVCQTPVEKYVDAVVKRVKFGNFQARYFPEQVDQYLATVDAEHARLAEGTLLGDMLTGSNLVTGALNELGAASDYFAHLDLALAGYRYRHRMAEDAPLCVWYPEWFEDEIRADMARELPGNSGGQSERMAVADSEIDSWFAARGVITTTFLDNPTGANPAQSWVAQGAGPILPWPTKVLSFIFHPAAWHFLDGGELNLGMVRDSTLNNDNSFEMFAETFEKAIFRGHESVALLLDLCPSGARQAVLDASTAICVAGS